MQILAFILILLFPSVALAWSEVYSWQPSPTATSYRVETSIDQGVTWQTAGSPVTPTFTLTMTSAGLTVVRVSACNANGCATRSGSGFWHNEAWSPPLLPANLLVP